jgi:RNA-directed DNA polymerase
MLPTTFTFLGFVHVWGTSRKGNTVVRQFTAKERLARSLKAFNQRCRRMMHWPVKAQHQRLWRRWLSRRSSRRYVTWERFERVLQRFALPPPRITHRYTST